MKMLQYSDEIDKHKLKLKLTFQFKLSQHLHAKALISLNVVKTFVYL